MASANCSYLKCFFFTLLCATIVVKDVISSGHEVTRHTHLTAYNLLSANREFKLKDGPRRLLIGSVAPICTYNECRRCKYKCRAEQVPVEGNDPINSAYHYKCVCHM